MHVHDIHYIIFASFPNPVIHKLNMVPGYPSIGKVESSKTRRHKQQFTTWR